MSVEAYTCEMLTVKNTNQKTSIFLERVGEYLLKTWGITELKISVDGKTYETDEESISEGMELYDVCKGLRSAADVNMFLRSCNNGGFNWRRESEFLSLLNNDDELKNNIVYKSTDYYDSDTWVDLCFYDKSGFEFPIDQFDSDIEQVKDIREWYCYTHDIVVETDEAGEKENDELHDLLYENLKGILVSVCGIDEKEVEDYIEDDWQDYGEILIEPSITFPTAKVEQLSNYFTTVMDEVKKHDNVNVIVEINAVPDGEGDYDFAVLSIKSEDGNLTIKSRRV